MKLFIGCAAILCLTVATAKAGDGQLSNHSLAAVGLGGMKAMSDDQGLDIRGLGVAEETQDQGGYGNNDHQKGEDGKHHEKKHEKKHEKHPQKPSHEVCCDKHEKDCGKSSCGHASCNFSSLCHIQSSAHKL